MSLGHFPLSWQAFGNLNNGTGNAGLSAVNGNNGLSNANWNIVARQTCFKSDSKHIHYIIHSAEKIT